MRRVAALAVCGAILLAFVVLLLGTNRPDETDYVVLCTAKTAPTVLATNDQNGESIFVLEQDNSTILLRANEHGTAARLDLDFAADWAAVYDDKIILRSGNSVKNYDTKNFDYISETDLHWDIDDIIYFSCDQNGTQYAVLSAKRKVLQIAQNESESSVQLDGEVTAFCDFSDGVWLSAGSKLIRQIGTSTATFSWSCPLFAAFNESTVLDCDGVLSVADETEIAPLLRCSQEFYSKLECCFDADSLIAASGKEVLCYDESGESAAHCELPADAMAVTKSGALFCLDGSLCYAPFVFEPVVTPTPSPLPTPNVPALHTEGELLICEPGTTVQELREMMKPEEAEIRDAAGRMLTSGRLSTGMTANAWTVIVMGDCNGSGTLTESDMQIAISMLLGEEPTSAEALRAIDFNESGKLETDDLLMLSKAIAGEK